MITKNQLKKYLQKTQLKKINNFCIFILTNPKILNELKIMNFKCFKLNSNFFLDFPKLQSLNGVLKGNTYIIELPISNSTAEIQYLFKKYKLRAVVYCVNSIFYTERQISEINSQDISAKTANILKVYYKFILLLKNKIHLLE